VTELRVGVAHALTEFALAAPVDRARRDCERVSVLLATGWSRELLARVQNGGLDAALLCCRRARRSRSESPVRR